MPPKRVVRDLQKEKDSKRQKRGERNVAIKRGSVPKAMHDKRELQVANMTRGGMHKYEHEGWQQSLKNKQAEAGPLDMYMNQDIGFEPDEFDVNQMWFNDEGELEADRMVGFFGKRRTGKTFAATWLAEQGKDYFPYGLVITDTRLNYYWQQHFPDDQVHEFDPVFMEMFKREHGKFIDKWNRSQWMKDHINPYRLIIMDDVVNNRFRYNDHVLDFATKGRHFKCSVWIMTQYPKLVATGVRSNMDYCFIFFTKTLNEKMAIAEEYLNTVDAKDAMAFITHHTQMDEGGKQRNVLVLDIVKNSPWVYENVYKCQPKKTSPFVIGCLDFWKQDMERYWELGGTGRDSHWMKLTGVFDVQ